MQYLFKRGIGNRLRSQLLRYWIPLAIFCISLFLHLLVFIVIPLLAIALVAIVLTTVPIWLPFAVVGILVFLTVYTLATWTPIGHLVYILYQMVTTEPVKGWVWRKLLIPILDL